MMSEQQEQADAVPAEGDGSGPDGAAEGRGGSAEAARYRRRARDAETARDTLVARVERLQRAQVEGLAAAHLHAPADLWLAGAELGELLDESGDVDPVKVADAARAAVTGRPHWRAGQVSADPDQGKRSGSGEPVNWSQIIKRG